MTPRQKAKNSILFGLSDNDQILLACCIKLILTTELQMEFQTSDVSLGIHCQTLFLT